MSGVVASDQPNTLLAVAPGSMSFAPSGSQSEPAWRNVQTEPAPFASSGPETTTRPAVGLRPSERPKLERFSGSGGVNVSSSVHVLPDRMKSEATLSAPTRTLVPSGASASDSPNATPPASGAPCAAHVAPERLYDATS